MLTVRRWTNWKQTLLTVFMRFNINKSQHIIASVTNKKDYPAETRFTEQQLEAVHTFPARMNESSRLESANIGRSWRKRAPACRQITWMWMCVILATNGTHTRTARHNICIINRTIHVFQTHDKGCRMRRRNTQHNAAELETGQRVSDLGQVWSRGQNLGPVPTLAYTMQPRVTYTEQMTTTTDNAKPRRCI